VSRFFTNTSKLIKLVFVIAFANTLVACSSKGVSEESERRFVEVDVDVPEAVYLRKDNRPIVYGMMVNQEYEVRISATKFMQALEGEMTIHIENPPEILVTGSSEWGDTDQSYAVETMLKPTQTGTFKVDIVACNLVIDFCSTNRMIIEALTSR